MPGKKSSLLVSDLMTGKVFTVKPGDDLAAVRELMYEQQVRHVPVVDRDGDLIGLISHRDLLRYSLAPGEDSEDADDFLEEETMGQLQAHEIMTTAVQSIAPDMDLREAAALMLENKYGCLPVVEGGRLVGIITEADFVRLMAQGG